MYTYDGYRHDIGVIYDESTSTLTIYIDCQERGICSNFTAIPREALGSMTDFYISKAMNSNTSTLDGQMRHFRLYNRKIRYVVISAINEVTTSTYKSTYVH